MATDQDPRDVHDSGGQFSEPTQTPEQAEESAVVNEVIEHLKFVKSYEDLQRKAEEEENEFEAVDMWEKEARDRRAEHNDEATGQKIPAKPTITANLLDHQLQTVISDARQARLSLTVKPKGGLALKKIGGYLKGLVRSIQVESGSLAIRLWALERTARVGRGGWMIVAEYANDGDFDLDLREKRILDYGTVYWDVYRQRPDNADAEKCLVTDWISEDERIRRWPDKPIKAPQNAWEDDNDWFASSGDDRSNRRCRVGWFYKVIHREYILGYHPQHGTGWVGDVPEKSKIPALPDAAAAEVKANKPDTLQRKVDVPSVRISTVDGTQELERHPWHGRFIPVIECIGKEYFVKGKRRWKGIIANAMDLSRAINVLLSAATEIAGAMPRAPYLMADGQDEGFEAMWDDAAIRNYTRLYYRQKDTDGQQAPPPQRQPIELQVQGLLLLLRMMHEMYHAVTGTVAPQLRAVNPQERSGRFVEALQRQGAAGTANYLDNMATISMLYEGKVLLDAIPHYYDKEGRILYVSGEDTEDEIAILIKRPFIRDAEGMPVPVPCEPCKGTGSIEPPAWKVFVEAQPCQACKGTGFPTRETMPKTFQDKEVEYVDFSEGEFQIVPAIDRHFQEKQEEALAGMEALARAVPEMVPIYADLWVEAMGFTGSQKVAERIRSRMPEGDEELKDIPPHLMGKFARLQQQHQQAMMALQEAHKMLESDAIKTAGQKEIAMIREAVRGQVEKLKIRGRMIEMREGLAADERLAVLQGKIESMQQEAQHKHEILLQLLKELGAKEQERHSVELHDAAAAKAADRADLSAAMADSRKEGMAERADGRKETMAERADGRKGALAADADVRKEGMARSADSRAEVSAERSDARAERSAERADQRAEQSAANADARAEQSAERADQRAESAAERQHARDLKSEKDRS